MIYYVETKDWLECRDFIGVFEGEDGLDVNQLWLEFCEQNQPSAFIRRHPTQDDDFFKNLVFYFELKRLKKITCEHVFLTTNEDDQL